jgi:hypothetical protein
MLTPSVIFNKAVYLILLGLGIPGFELTRSMDISTACDSLIVTNFKLFLDKLDKNHSNWAQTLKLAGSGVTGDVCAEIVGSAAAMFTNRMSGSSISNASYNFTSMKTQLCYELNRWGIDVIRQPLVKKTGFLCPLGTRGRIFVLINEIDCAHCSSHPVLLD